MKVFASVIIHLFFVTTAFASSNIAKCSFRSNASYEASAEVREELSRNGKFILVKMYASILKDGTSYPWTELLMIKSLDDSISILSTNMVNVVGDPKDIYVGYTEADLFQTMRGSRVSLRMHPSNEKFSSKVELDEKTQEIKQFEIRQKIYNSPSDLILPLNVNRISCKF